MGKGITLFAVCGYLLLLCQCSSQPIKEEETLGYNCRDWIKTRYAGVDQKSTLGGIKAGDCILDKDSFVTFHSDGSADYEIIAWTQAHEGGRDAMHITIDAYGQRSQDLVCDNLGGSGDETKCPNTIPAGTFNLDNFDTSTHPDHNPPAFAWQACC